MIREITFSCDHYNENYVDLNPNQECIGTPNWHPPILRWVFWQRFRQGSACHLPATTLWRLMQALAVSELWGYPGSSETGATMWVSVSNNHNWSEFYLDLPGSGTTSGCKTAWYIHAMCHEAIIEEIMMLMRIEWHIFITEVWLIVYIADVCTFFRKICWENTNILLIDTENGKPAWLHMCYAKSPTGNRDCMHLSDHMFWMWTCLQAHTHL